MEEGKKLNKIDKIIRIGITIFILLFICASLALFLAWNHLNEYNNYYQDCYDENVTVIAQYIDLAGDICPFCLVIKVETKNGSTQYHPFGSEDKPLDHIKEGQEITLDWCYIEEYDMNAIRGIK